MVQMETQHSHFLGAAAGAGLGALGLDLGWP